VEDWLKKLPPNGDPLRGRAPFEKVCAQCHSLDGLGHPVGPDLTALAHRSVEDLLSNILDPNMAIHPNYVSYTAETVGGELESGLLQSESSETVVLLQPEGRKATLARKQIKRLESSGLSLMPEGLEAGMTPAELRDLIAFIQQRK
jgi:putative heme-binding domain-containing protein